MMSQQCIDELPDFARRRFREQVDTVSVAGAAEFRLAQRPLSR